MNTEKDKYDLEIEYLTKHPEDIELHWLGEITEFNRSLGPTPLFMYCYKGEGLITGMCGCLTQIRLGIRGATDKDGDFDAKLTKEIREDNRIPKDEDSITIKDLPVFAKWQRRLDKEIRS